MKRGLFIINEFLISLSIKIILIDFCSVSVPLYTWISLYMLFKNFLSIFFTNIIYVQQNILLVYSFSKFWLILTVDSPVSVSRICRHPPIPDPVSGISFYIWNFQGHSLTQICKSKWWLLLHILRVVLFPSSKLDVSVNYIINIIPVKYNIAG